MFNVYYTIVQYTAATGTYWKTSTGKSCPVGQVVLTENACVFAAKELGMKFNRDTNLCSYFGCEYQPAGCFFHKEELLFNFEINPLMTNPNNSYGSVCTKGIITEFNVVLENIDV